MNTRIFSFCHLTHFIFSTTMLHVNLHYKASYLSSSPLRNWTIWLLGEVFIHHHSMWCVICLSNAGVHVHSLIRSIKATKACTTSNGFWLGRFRRLFSHFHSDSVFHTKFLFFSRWLRFFSLSCGYVSMLSKLTSTVEFFHVQRNTLNCTWLVPKHNAHKSKMLRVFPL